jgi:KDO2-lipid IV(A) lauroyltransferase
VGLTTIYRDESPRELLRRLHRNEVIGILPDQDIDSLNGIFVEFFGRPAYTPVAPAKLALACRAPILPNFLVRLPGGRYRILVEDPIRPEEYAGRPDAVEAVTTAWMKACEKVIRRYPDQWSWMHDRWKTRPGRERVA